MGSTLRGSIEQYFKEGKIITSHPRESNTATSYTEDVQKDGKRKECNHEASKDTKADGKPTKKDKKPDTKTRNKKKSQAATIQKQVVKEEVQKSSLEPRNDKNLKQSSITAHFQVRRSGRRCVSALKNEEQEKLMQRLLDEDESGLEVKVMEDKGRGVFAARNFNRGELICEYAGELIDYELGLEREKVYADSSEFGCYSYFFQYKNKRYCVDATKESHRLGRLLNHSKTNRNVATKVLPVKDIPRLILVAKRDIKTGEELLYDYGDRNKMAIENHPWLKS